MDEWWQFVAWVVVIAVFLWIMMTDAWPIGLYWRKRRAAKGHPDDTSRG